MTGVTHMMMTGTYLAPLDTVSSIGLTSVSGTDVVAWPSVQAGDLVILMDLNVKTPRSAAFVPTGFTQILTNADTATFNPRTMLSYKICTGAETGSFTAMEVGGGTEKILWQLRGNVPILTANPVGFASQATDGNPSSLDQAASAGSAPLVVVAGVRNGSTSNFSTQSPAFAHTKAEGPCRLSGTIYNSSPLDHSIDASDGGTTNVLFSGYIELG